MKKQVIQSICILAFFSGMLIPTLYNQKPIEPKNETFEPIVVTAGVANELDLCRSERSLTAGISSAFSDIRIAQEEEVRIEARILLLFMQIQETNHPYII